MDVASDDDRISYLEGHVHDLDDVSEPGLTELKDLLASPAIWAQPASSLESDVVAAVSAAAVDDAPTAVPTPAVTRRRRRRRRALGAIAGAAATAAAVTLVFVSTGDPQPEQLQAALASTDVVPDAAGTATFTRTDSGWQIELDALGLPRLTDGRYYQAWLKRDDGVTVPIGTFNDGDDVTLWAGVSPRDFPTMTVTDEATDGDQTSSGRVVLVGAITDG